MKKLFFVLLLSFVVLSPLEAQWCGYPCTERYYNPGWASNDSWYYGYIDINEYPYALPVNYYFNPRPCVSCRSYDNYRYLIYCYENSVVRERCPHCNGYHE